MAGSLLMAGALGSEGRSRPPGKKTNHLVVSSTCKALTFVKADTQLPAGALVFPFFGKGSPLKSINQKKGCPVFPHGHCCFLLSFGKGSSQSTNKFDAFFSTKIHWASEDMEKCVCTFASFQRPCYSELRELQTGPACPASAHACGNGHTTIDTDCSSFVTGY